MSEAFILFAHGARDPEWAGPLERLREAMRAASPHAVVSLAFLEFMQPGLPEAIDDLVAAGMHAVRVVPVFLAQGGHVKRDLPAMMAAARLRHPGLTLTLAHALGESDAVIAVMAQVALAPGSSAGRD